MSVYAIINEAYGSVFGPSLASLGYCCLSLPPYPVLQKPVSAHADMLILSIGNTHFLPEQYAKLPHVRSLLSQIENCCDVPDHDRERPVFRSIQNPLSDTYPQDVALNALVCGNFIFSHPGVLSPEVAQYARERSLTVLPVRQGYAGCSSIALPPHAILTCDQGIGKTARSVGLEVLMLPPGMIRLAGYTGNGGMPGGAAGTDIRSHTLFLCGAPPTPVVKEMQDFCSEHRWQIKILTSLPWTDVGGIRFI